MRINAAARQLETKSPAQGDAVRYEDALRLAALAKAGGDPKQQQEQPSAEDTTKNTLEQSKKDGYEIAGPESQPPSVADMKLWSEEPGDVFRYETVDGKKVAVAKSDNPELYETAKGAGETWNQINRSVDDGYSLASDGDAVVPLDKLMLFSREPGDLFRFETTDGKKVVVSKDLSPDLYEQSVAQGDTWDTINSSEKNGYKLAGAEDYPDDKDITRWGWPDELGPGLIQFETKDGKFVVAEDINAPLYDRILDKAEGTQAGAIDDIRKEHEIPAAKDINVLDLKTDAPVDSEKPDGDKLSASELATKTLLEDYKKGVEDGKIEHDDPRAKLVRAMEAKAATENGRGIIGYEEDQGFFGGTWRSSDDEQTQMTGDDLSDIIDGHGVDESMASLFQDETIAKDYKTRLDDAVAKIPNKDEVKKQLEETLLGKDDQDTRFLDYIQDLKGQGLDHAAQTEMASLIQSLTLLDPEKGKLAAQTIQKDALTADLNELVGDPSKVSEENKDLATKDLFGLLKGVIKSETFDVPRRTVETIDKFMNEFLAGKTDQKKVVQAITEAADAANANGGKLSQADLDRFSAYVPMKDREGLSGFLGTMSSKGILGSLGGGVSLASGVYQLVGKGGQLANTPEERMAIAKDFISFAGASSHFIKTGDAIMDVLGKGGLSQTLGLDKTLPEIWGKQGLWGKEIEKIQTGPGGGLPEIPDGVADDFRSQMGIELNRIFDNAQGATPDGAPKNVPGVSDDMYDGIAKMFDDEAAKAGAASDPSRAAKIAGSTVKVLGSLADGVAGVADLVLGALTIKSGVESGSDLTKAQGALQVVSCVAGGAAGAIGIAGLLGPVAAGVSAAAGPLFLVGVALAGIGAIIGFFVDHEKKQKATDAEGQWFKDLANDGLLQEDWGDKVEYARYSIHHYGGRIAPEDVSLYEFQKDEWDYFHKTAQEDGSSSNRLNEDLHKELAA